MEPPKLFATLPTTAEIVEMIELDGYLCALTADQTIWVLNADGDIVTNFHRLDTEDATTDESVPF